MTRAIWFWYSLGFLTAAEHPLWPTIDRHLQTGTPETFPDRRVAWTRYPEQPDLLLATLRVPIPQLEQFGIATYSLSLYRGGKLLLRYDPAVEKDAQPTQPWFPVRTALSPPGPDGASLFAVTMDVGRTSGIWGTLHMRAWVITSNAARPSGSFDAAMNSEANQILTATSEALRLAYGTRSITPGQRSPWFRTLHFTLRNGRLERVPPIALDPRDFIEELFTERNDRWMDEAVRDRGPILLQRYLEYRDTYACSGGVDWAVVFDHAVFRVQNLGNGEWRLTGAGESIPEDCRK